MQYVVDEKGNKVNVIISIQEYNEYIKLKSKLLFGSDYEETEEDLILSKEEQKEIEKLRMERKKGNLKKL